MQPTEHAIATARPKGMTPERVTGLVFAGLLQAALIFALIEGLNIKVWPQPDHSMTGEVVVQTNRVKPLEPPPLPRTENPVPVSPVAPHFQIDEGSSVNQGITVVQGPATPVNDHAASGIGATHTTPPYPPLALRLSEEGSVQLRLTISAQGLVTDAMIVRSSGYEDLDQAAHSWILAHWRYRPALRGGVAVPSTSDVQVRFDLKSAH